MIQEGVYTFESINEAVAEPVVYMIDHFVVGGFYRVHTGRGTDENLNAPGMHFVPLAFDDGLPDCPTAAPTRTPRPTASMPTASSRGWRCWRPASNWTKRSTRPKTGRR